ncbi:hypothetical protein [Vannielia litorea]|uniref:Uncharacterized protein n=1 Tax=Vannielia litorea TaxID=1217970 RepID=A0A1N6F632_9RHOB|nr:hypothetical protein [Vannielia litorea]SIN90664.1 hypothetical protein SAMN05444002_1402 [Vannielia litorea]
MKRSLIIILSVVVLAGVGSLGWLGYRGISGLFSVFTEVDDPVISMHAAMADNRDDEAYGYLAQDLQAKVGPEEFEREFRAQQIWGDDGTFSFTSRNISGKLARIKGSYTRADGSVLPVFVELVHEREQWKISRFHFGSPPPGQEEWEI